MSVPSSPNVIEASCRPVVFLDRDGTLIEERDYLGDPALVSLVPGCISGLKLLKERGFALMLVTNQSGVARGVITTEQVHAVNGRLEDLLAEHGVRLDNISICFHLPDDNCECRKPGAGLVAEIAKIFEIDYEGSWVIGDKCSDVGLGDNIGAKTILIRPDNVEPGDANCVATEIVGDFGSAASYIDSVTRNDATLSH